MALVSALDGDVLVQFPEAKDSALVSAACVCSRIDLAPVSTPSHHNVEVALGVTVVSEGTIAWGVMVSSGMTVALKVMVGDGLVVTAWGVIVVSQGTILVVVCMVMVVSRGGNALVVV